MRAQPIVIALLWLAGPAWTLPSFAAVHASTCPPQLAPLPIEDQHPYDELRLPDGSLRPVNLEPYTLSQRIPKARIDAFDSKFRSLSGGVALDPRPRVLTLEEQQRIHAGIRQRAGALRLFLEDYYSGRKSFLEAGILTPEALRRIVGRTAEAGYEGRVKPESISFHYGPDLLRGPDGAFYVIEDNSGYLGGFGDLLLSRTAMLENLPEYRDVLPTELSPEKFYADLIESWRRQRNPPDGKIVMVTHGGGSEQERLAKTFAAYDVAWVTPDSQARLETNAEGVWFKASKTATPERVGYVFVYGEFHHIDSTDPTARRGALLWKGVSGLSSSEVHRARVPLPETGEPDWAALGSALGASATGYWDQRAQKGLVDAILTGKVGSSVTPGVDFLGDKELHPVVDDLVRFYLHEEPLLPSIEGRSLAIRDSSGHETLNRELFDRIFTGQGYKNFVLKRVDGRGGKSAGGQATGVFIGPKMTAADIKEAEGAIQADPGGFIAQPYIPMSSYDEMIVDLRFHAAVSPEGIIISPIPISRAISAAKGDGKVNISGHGRLFAVFVENRPERLVPREISPDWLASLPAPASVPMGAGVAGMGGMDAAGGVWSRWWDSWVRRLGFRR